jgi:hypothetical protein
MSNRTIPKANFLTAKPPALIEYIYCLCEHVEVHFSEKAEWPGVGESVLEFTLRQRRGEKSGPAQTILSR